MAVPVNVYITDTATVPAAVAGAVVGVYDPATYAFIATGTSDANGLAALMLPGAPTGQVYELRFYKIGYVFTNPQMISVYEPEDVNNPNGFTALTTASGEFGVPLDPRLCRVVGRFLNYQNRPSQNILVRLQANIDLAKKIPKIVDGNLISPSAMDFHTDSNGYVIADLFRTGEYFVEFAGEDDETWSFKVPDRATAILSDLIHPRPVAVVYTDGNTVTVALNTNVTIPLTVSWSDYIDHADKISTYMSFMNSDPTIIDVTFNGSTELTVRGLQAGTASITVELADVFPTTVPPTTITAPTLIVTVTS